MISHLASRQHRKLRDDLARPASFARYQPPRLTFAGRTSAYADQVTDERNSTLWELNLVRIDLAAHLTPLAFLASVLPVTPDEFYWQCKRYFKPPYSKPTVTQPVRRPFRERIAFTTCRV
jgi:hypothetical protein